MAGWSWVAVVEVAGCGMVRCDPAPHLSRHDTKVASESRASTGKSWHLQNLMLDPNNAKSGRDRRMCDKLDKEKGR